MEQTKAPGKRESIRKQRWVARRYFKHLATLPAKLRTRRERIRQAQLQNQRIQRLSPKLLRRFELDDRKPETVEERAKLAEEKRQLSREIAALRKTIDSDKIERVLKVVDDVNAQRLLARLTAPKKESS